MCFGKLQGENSPDAACLAVPASGNSADRPKDVFAKRPQEKTDHGGGNARVLGGSSHLVNG